MSSSGTPAEASASRASSFHWRATLSLALTQILFVAISVASQDFLVCFHATDLYSAPPRLNLDSWVEAPGADPPPQKRRRKKSLNFKTLGIGQLSWYWSPLDFPLRKKPLSSAAESVAIREEERFAPQHHKEWVFWVLIALPTLALLSKAPLQRALFREREVSLLGFGAFSLESIFEVLLPAFLWEPISTALALEFSLDKWSLYGIGLVAMGVVWNIRKGPLDLVVLWFLVGCACRCRNAWPWWTQTPYTAATMTMALAVGKTAEATGLVLSSGPQRKEETSAWSTSRRWCASRTSESRALACGLLVFTMSMIFYSAACTKVAQAGFLSWCDGNFLKILILRWANEPETAVERAQLLQKQFEHMEGLNPVQVFFLKATSWNLDEGALALLLQQTLPSWWPLPLRTVSGNWLRVFGMFLVLVWEFASVPLCWLHSTGRWYESVVVFIVCFGCTCCTGRWYC